MIYFSVDDNDGGLDMPPLEGDTGAPPGGDEDLEAREEQRAQGMQLRARSRQDQHNAVTPRKPVSST